MSISVFKQVLRRNQVVTATGLSASSIYNLERQGHFPRHFMLSPRCAGWDAEAVNQWIIDRTKNTSAGAPVTRIVRPSMGEALS